MKQFSLINPHNIQQAPRVIGSLIDDRRPEITYYILIDGTHAIIGVCDLFTNLRTKEKKWLTYQLEMPKRGIPWIVHPLENKFFKLSHEGGLPAGVRHFHEFVDGEELGISRSMGLGCDDNREAGYTFSTLSRKDERGTVSKEMSFTDTFLFKHGFFDLLKATALKIENGIL